MTSHHNISYAITVCNEAEDLERLIKQLLPYIQSGDEIVVQADANHVTDHVKAVVEHYQQLITTYCEHPLNLDFAAAKNHLNSLCHGEYIFQLDADELPHPWLLEHLQIILRRLPWIDLFKLPRNNRFLTPDGELLEQRVAWPDFQGRLYRNKPSIQWKRPLHERIHGHWFYWHLPKQEQYALIHTKIKDQDARKWDAWRQHYAQS